MKKFFILLLKPLSFIPALCMMYLIFSFSGQSGEQSGALSQKISREIVVVADKALDKNLDETRIQYYTDKLEFPVRKAAHISPDRPVYSRSCPSWRRAERSFSGPLRFILLKKQMKPRGFSHKPLLFDCIIR